MGRRALSYPRAVLRRAGVTVVATAVVVGVLGPAAGSASAQAAAEVVIGPYGQSIQPEHVLSVGRTGFLHRLPGAARQWTDYATGRTTTPDIPDDGSVQRVINTHADTIAYQTGTGEAVLIDPVSGDKKTMRLPGGFTLRTVQGNTALGYANGECHLFRFAADGSLQDRPVTDVPEGATCGEVSTVTADTGDGAGVVVQYRSSAAREYGFGVIDLATARFSTLPVTVNNSAFELQLTPRTVSWYERSSIRVMPRDDPQATPWSVPNPRPPYSMISRLVGSTVLWMNGGGPVTAVTADGTTSQVLDFVQGDNTSALPGPDGSLLMVGKLDHEYAVHRFTEGADGSLQRAEVLDIPWHPSRTTSLALSQGRLATADTYFGGAAAYHEQKLALSGTPSVLTRENLGSADAGECDAAGCPLLYPTGDGRVLHQGVDSGGKAELRLIDKSKTAPGTRITTGLTGLSVESVSGRYVAYRTASATEVRDIDSRAVVRKTSAAPGALWGATLWQSAGAGKVTATDVRTGTVNRTLSLGTTSCTPSSVQATARYLYVECGSASARVVKLSDGSVRSLSTGSAPGLLGDGFVVRVGADRQVALTDLTPATPATRVLGTARGTAAGRDWTVDPYGGHVAYVDTGGDVHVVPTGITTGVLGVTDSSVATSARVALDVPSWRPTWWISKPVASWQLTLKNKVSGKTVRTLTGGEARGQIATTWDGWTGVTGIGVPDATYTWTLTARPADGQGAALIKSGSVKISGARPAHHDFVGFGGIGDLLTLNSSGAFTFQHGTGKGTFSGKTSASGWPTSAIAVPFGVLGGGDHNVVLVRLSSGELRSYRPNGGALRPSTPYTSLGKGWNAYNALTSPGDLTGDGRPDLVARKASTGDIYLFAGTSTGKLAAGKRINTAWTAYTRIIGVGDLNGDGIGEVLARHKDGTLYRYDGRGNGTLKSRVTVFTKWGASYNAIVGVGDITGDGKPDLVARDTAGNLYRNNGKGNGSFSGRVKIATGWKGYKGIF